MFTREQILTATAKLFAHHISTFEFTDISQPYWIDVSVGMLNYRVTNAGKITQILEDGEINMMPTDEVWQMEIDKLLFTRANIEGKIDLKANKKQ